MTALERPLGLYEKAIPNFLSWQEKFTIAGNAGYDFLELSIDATEEKLRRLQWGTRELDDIKRASDATGVHLRSIAMTANRFYPLGHRDESVRCFGLDIIRRSVDLAVRLGVGFIQIATYDVYDEESDGLTKERFIDSLAAAALYAAQNDIDLALETMDTPFADSLEKIRDIIEQIGEKNIKVYADIGNLAAFGYDFSDEVRHAQDLIVAVHLKDARPGIIRRIPFGKGIVDFPAAFTVLKTIDFSGLLVVEMWSDEKMSFIPYLSTASKFIRREMSHHL